MEIPKLEIKNLMDKLQISEKEAVDLWKCDHDLEVDEEQEELNKKASAVQVGRGVGKKVQKSEKKPRTVKVSNEKQALFQSILRNIDRCEGIERENVRILKENKLIEVQIGEKRFKIDLIECRK